MKNKNAPELSPESANENTPDFSTGRPLYAPLRWIEKPAKFRGKDKRSTRRDAIARKRGQHGNALIDALVLCAVFALIWLML